MPYCLQALYNQSLAYVFHFMPFFPLLIHRAPIFPVHQSFRVFTLSGSSSSLYVLLLRITHDLNVICFRKASLASSIMTHLLFNPYHNLKLLFLYVCILSFPSYPLILEYMILEKYILEGIFIFLRGYYLVCYFQSLEQHLAYCIC